MRRRREFPSVGKCKNERTKAESKRRMKWRMKMRKEKTVKRSGRYLWPC